MNAKRLIEQLRREATRNPKQAAFLGIGLVVAGYFWAPLVWGWVKPADMPVPQPPAAATATPAPAPAPADNATNANTTASANATAAKPVETTATWQQLIQWMQDDMRKHSAGPAGQRDPFQYVEAEKEVKPQEERPVEDVKPVSPESLGMVLTMTVVSGKKSLARINSKTYKLGATVELSKEGKSHRFELVDVQTRQVVLQHDGHRFPLAVASSRRSDVIETAKHDKEDRE